VDFQAGLSGTITLTTGELLIARDVHLDGPGAGVITVSGNNASRVFDIASTSTATISGLTVGSGVSSLGGGIANAGTLTVTDLVIRDNTATTTGNPLGGGIHNAGTMTVVNCTITHNLAKDLAQGGGIDNAGTLTITGSDISDNTALEGGGISNTGILTLSDTTVRRNAATAIPFNGGYSGGFGGGILNAVATLTLTNSVIGDNKATFGGGGIQTQFAVANLIDCTVLGNSATELSSTGGGIYQNLGTLIITGSVIRGNTANSGSGISSFGTLTVIDSTISDNMAGLHSIYSSAGGGIFNFNSSALTVVNSTISRNAAIDAGGGIFTEDGSVVAITDSTISGNTSKKGGGVAIVNGDGSPDDTIRVQLLNCTISGNTASGSQTAGGIDSSSIFRGSVAVHLLNCTISNNMATGTSERGSQLFSGQFSLGHSDIQFRNTILSGSGTIPGLLAVGGGTFTSAGHNFIFDGTGSSGFTSTDLVGTPASPLDPKLGPLQDNGGPTSTMALLSGSPAIDAGGLTDIEWDQRGPGFPRLVNGATDIGAYEVRDGDDARPMAHTPWFPKAAIAEPGTALGRPLAATPAPTCNSTANVLSSQGVAAVDQAFAWPRREQARFFWSRPWHPDPEAGDS
jgi:hypothetical protein